MSRMTIISDIQVERMRVSGHESYCNDLEIVGFNHCQVELELNTVC